jgi:hypothetical protein
MKKPKTSKGRGWHKDSHRHSLARQGVKTGRARRIRLPSEDETKLFADFKSESVDPFLSADKTLEIVRWSEEVANRQKERGENLIEKAEDNRPFPLDVARVMFEINQLSHPNDAFANAYDEENETIYGYGLERGANYVKNRVQKHGLLFEIVSVEKIGEPGRQVRVMLYAIRGAKNAPAGENQARFGKFADQLKDLRGKKKGRVQ